MSTLYAPGNTPVAVTPRGFAVLENGASAALLARIKALVAEGRGLGGVIEALTGAYGASITALPAFAVAIAEGEAVRLAVRGAFVFEVEGASTEQVSGEGVTTWTERVVAGAARVALTTTEGGASTPAEFEIADGIVLAAAIIWDASGSTSAATPERVAEPAPVTPAPPVTPAAPESIAEPTPHPGPAEPSLAPVAELRLAPVAAVPAVPVIPAAPEPPQAVAPEPPASSGHGLIDSRAVLSIADGETLLPFDSELSAHPADDPEPHPADFDASLGATVIRTGEAGVVTFGDVLDLGDGITVAIEAPA